MPNSQPQQIVACVVYTDRMIEASAAQVIHNSKKIDHIELGWSGDDSTRLYRKTFPTPPKQDELVEALREAMSEVCKKRPASLVLASPSPLKSTAPSERGFDSSGYGVTEASGLFPAWSGLDLYALACDACASIIDPMDIHVQLDVALASLGEYHWRLNHKELTSETTRQKQKLYAARVGRSVDQVIFDEHSVSYVKLSSDINAALTQQGVLFEGKGNPYLSMLHPHRCNIIDHGFNDDFEGDCSLHNDCFGGMLTQRALKRRVEIYRSDGLSMNEIALRKALVIVEYAVQLCEILVAAHRPSLIVLDGRVVNDRDSEMGPDGLLISAINDQLYKRLAVIDADGNVSLKPSYIQHNFDEGFRFVQAASCPNPLTYGALAHAANIIAAAGKIVNLRKRSGKQSME
ncbi:hypothetical protein [Ponticaulis sp.]|uniref:hypothetical protein n=1 Tax=Ponticaulis sp. TaxID=2020902 RepID=UPI000C5CC4B6|nr:hypothetical protein [Ponticaulis sp.]MBN04194.1 hypothetical protein [Ponticaulis sp.]